MSRNVLDTLAASLSAETALIGQIQIRRVADGFELRHVDDAQGTELALYTRTEDARALSLYDDGGNYRPLKTAPNLRRGWRFLASTLSDLRQVLDCFYPAMLGVLHSWQCGKLEGVPLRETLARQTGMYAITKKLRDDEATILAVTFCAKGCLKLRLWGFAEGDHALHVPENFVADGNVLPMPCQEACNLFVAEARKVVKRNSTA